MITHIATGCELTPMPSGERITIGRSLGSEASCCSARQFSGAMSAGMQTWPLSIRCSRYADGSDSGPLQTRAAARSEANYVSARWSR